MANTNANRVGVFRQAADSIFGFIFSPPVEAVEPTAPRRIHCEHPPRELATDNIGDVYCGLCGEDMTE